MTETFYRTRNYKIEYSTCGSKIYEYDFNGYISLSDMATRIASDLAFDKQCRINAINRDNKNTLSKEE